MYKYFKPFLFVCLFSTFVFSMEVERGLQANLLQFKTDLITLKEKLSMLHDDLAIIKVILEYQQLKKTANLNQDEVNFIPFYCDAYKINPGDGEKRTWSTFIADMKDGGNYNNIDLFDEHSYIRWIFPTYYKGWSGSEHLDHNQTVVGILKNNPILIDRILESFRVFVGGYYKLKIEVEVQNSQKRNLDVVTISINESQLTTTIKHMSKGQFSHNLKRIKRVLHSLMAFGLENYAQSFLQCLKELGKKDSDINANILNGYKYEKEVTEFHKYFNKYGKYTGPEHG